MALATVMSYGLYNGCIVDHAISESGHEGNDLICIAEEVSPVHVTVPEYIAQRQVYTEKDCRFVCRQIAKAIKRFHQAGIAHRNLHLNNVLVDPWVSRNVCKKSDILLNYHITLRFCIALSLF